MRTKEYGSPRATSSAASAMNRNEKYSGDFEFASRDGAVWARLLD
jgi:hypothetical protein